MMKKRAILKAGVFAVLLVPGACREKEAAPLKRPEVVNPVQKEKAVAREEATVLDRIKKGEELTLDSLLRLGVVSEEAAERLDGGKIKSQNSKVKMP